MKVAIAAVVALALIAPAAARKPADKIMSKKPHHVFHAQGDIDSMEACLRPKVGKLVGNLVTARPPGRVDYLINEGFWAITLLPDQGGTRIEERNILMPLKGMDAMIEDCGGVEVAAG